jgi:hypothetical protein
VQAGGLFFVGYWEKNRFLASAPGNVQAIRFFSAATCTTESGSLIVRETWSLPFTSTTIAPSLENGSETN